ncbi:hypothetical protein Tco_0588107 [Tanacetum coccineum]
MTRSSTNKVFTPFKDPEREFCSSRKLFKTLSLDESRSPVFDLFFYLEENFEEEVTETMAETIEEYMSKTRADYGSGIARPKIDDKYHFKLKGQFLKELRDNTFSGSEHEDANEHIEKVLEIVDLFHVLNITQDQVMLRVFPMSLTGAKMKEINNFQQEPDETLYQAWERFKELFMKCPQHYLTEMQEVILFYNGLEVPTRQILDSKGVIPTKTAADAKVAIQEMAEYSQKWHNGTSKTRSTETSDGLAAIQVQLNNLGREIKKLNEKVYAAQVGCELCKGPYYTKDCPFKNEGKTLEEAYYTQFGVPFQQGGQYRAAAPGFYQRNNANPSHEENSNLIKEIRASTDAAIRNQGALIKTLEIQIGQMRKVLQERGFGSLPSSTKTNLRDHVKSISTTVEADVTPIRRIGSSQYAVSAQQNTTRVDDYLPRKEKDLGSFTLLCYINNVFFENALADLGASVSVMPLSTNLNLGLGELAHTKLTVELADRTVKHPKGIAENVLVGIGKFVFPIDFIILDIPEDVKVPLILGRPFLSTAHAKIDVFKRKITLRVGDEKIIFKSVKPASSLIKRVYILSLRERMELDLRDQVDNLIPTIEEGEVVDRPMIEEVRTRNKNKMVSKIIGYPSGYDEDE